MHENSIIVLPDDPALFNTCILIYIQLWY